jgi:hypothetical protein
LRPTYDPQFSLAQYEKGIKELTDAGATVIIFTVVDKVEGKGKIAKLWHERFSAFNDHVRVVASKYPTILFEGKKAEFLNTQSFLSSDRLHMNSEGHRRLANAVLEGLGYEFDPNWNSNIPLGNGKKISIKPLSNIAWVVTFLIPWIWRRLRGKSSGDGRKAKHSEPIIWPAR